MSSACTARKIRPSTRLLMLLASVALAVSSGSSPLAQSHGHRVIAAKDLVWVDLPALPPGAKLAVIEGPPNQAVPITLRIRFPAGYRLPPHSHPVVERLTVLSGTVYMGMGTRLDTDASSPLEPGGVMILEAGHPHFLWTREAAEVQIHGTGPFGTTYVNPADDPRNR